jgi:hypothetical protein
VIRPAEDLCVVPEWCVVSVEPLRVCAHPGCRTKLRRSNPTQTCSVHNSPSLRGGTLIAREMAREKGQRMKRSWLACCAGLVHRSDCPHRAGRKRGDVLARMTPVDVRAAAERAAVTEAEPNPCGNAMCSRKCGRRAKGGNGYCAECHREWMAVKRRMDQERAQLESEVTV